jgi:hypothetical protein
MLMKNLKKLASELLKEKSSKIDIATAFVWFHYMIKNEEVTITQVNEYFSLNNLPKYNTTYLKENFRRSPNVTKGATTDTYKPARRFMDEMEKQFSFVIERDEEITADDIIIPDSLVIATRGYIANLSKQINACYVHNIFDGCAVLMRRLLEILIIHSYEALNKETEISDSNGFKNLSTIINHTISTRPFKLTKEVYETLDEFRQVGNFSAHRIHYNAKRKDIDNVRLKFRITVEELLYQSGLKK